MSTTSNIRDLVIVGGGEHAAVLADAAYACSAFRLIGYLDLQERLLMRDRWGLKLLGDDRWLASHPDVLAVLGVGGVRASTARSDVVGRIGLPADRWAAVVHPSAWISPSAQVGAGVVVMAGAIIQTGAMIGAHAIINSGSIIEHDVSIGEFTQVGPGAVIGGGSEVGDGSFIGLGSCVRDHVRIGPSATIGMGAVVIRDVEANVTVRGVPAYEWRK